MTVREQILKIIRIVSPYTKDGVEITDANLNSVEPEAFTKQRILDAYNESRRVLFQAISSRLDKQGLELALKELVAREVKVVSQQMVEKPDGFIRLVRAYNGSVLPVVPVMEELDLQTETIIIRNPKYQPSITRQFIVDSGQFLQTYGASNGDNIGLHFYRLSKYQMSDVTGDTKETYNSIYHPALVQISEAVLQSDGQTNPLAVAQLLIGGQE